MMVNIKRIIVRVMAVSLCVSLTVVCAPHKKVAAGILPYAYDAKGRAYFLLGQEPNGEWADFGGRADRTDRGSKMTAMREFAEETRCVFGMQHDKKRGAKRHVSYPTCMKLSNRYIAPKMGRPLLHPRGYYVMYVAQVSYIPETVFNTAPKIPHYEKQRYEWVPAHKFIAQVRRSQDRRATWFEHKKMRAPFVDMIKSHADEILQTITQR